MQGIRCYRIMLTLNFAWSFLEAKSTRTRCSRVSLSMSSEVLQEKWTLVQPNTLKHDSPTGFHKGVCMGPRQHLPMYTDCSVPFFREC